MTANLWCRCEHYLRLGGDQENPERVRCHECHPSAPCWACGHPGTDQALTPPEGGVTYGQPTPVTGT